MTPVTRRQLLQAGAGLAATGAGMAAYGVNARAATAAAAERTTTTLTTDWLFGGRYVEGSTAPDFDDSGFERVTVPHCVAAMSWSNWDVADWEAEWIYRRRFDRPAGWAGQRVFLDFAGALTGTTPVVNGTRLDQHLGGYLPFGYEITDLLLERGNVLAVIVDGRWLNVPPQGRENGAISVDYLQPAGLYREVSLRVVPPVFVDDVFARPVDVLSPDRYVDVECTIDGTEPVAGARIEVALTDGGREVARASAPVTLDQPGRATVRTRLVGLADIRLWDVDDPQLYGVVSTLVVGEQVVHEHRTRIGFREARFEVDGFFLNGRRLKLFGVNRHQTYPCVGMAMPARAQRKDAELLRTELNCNAVRCSHYPQSEHFLDACDELGMLVFEEIPGWQYVGDAAWQDLAVRDTEVMIRRDRNRPSIAVWGVRINESGNFPDFYARTEQVAKRLDDSRPTSGAMVGGRYSLNDFQHDVFAYNDYLHTPTVATLRPPLPGTPFFVTEAVGSLAGHPLYRHIDTVGVQARQAYLHAQVHNQVGSDDRYAGLVAWSGIDYQSLSGGNRIHRNLKWNGVLDTFRMPKLGAAFYRSQVDPRVRPVIEPAFYWDFGPMSPPSGPGAGAAIWSNCDRLEVYVGGRHHATATPAVGVFPYLRYPPSFVDLTVPGAGAGELRIDGYADGRRVLSRSFSPDPADDRLAMTVDDAEIVADGSDATRIAFRAVDRHGAPRPYEEGLLELVVEGPGELVGDNPFDLGANGGVGAVWVRGVPGRVGPILVRARHARLGSAVVRLTSVEASE